MRQWSLLIPLIALLGGTAFCWADRVEAVDVAVIVNKHNAVDDFSLEDLVRVFRQDRQYWSPGKKIGLILQWFQSKEKQLILRQVYRMDDQELKQFWLGKMFKGEIEAFPVTVTSNLTVKELVSQLDEAIGFVNVSVIDATVKAVRINGKLPGEPGYVLHDEYL